MRSLEGDRGVAGRRFAVVASRFNDVVVERLVEGARACFAKLGLPADSLDVVWVPGAFELPLVARRLAGSGAYDAVVCLGAVIRGETAHFEHVATQAAAGIARASLDAGVPVMFGLVTTDTLEQAMDRAGGAQGNKGWDAAAGAVEMAALMHALPKEPGPWVGETR